MIKVLYDISWLGLTHSAPSGPTGLGRVIATLASYLSRSGECNLTLCAGRSFVAVDECRRYLAGNEEMRHLPFAYPKGVGYIGIPLHRVATILYGTRRPSLCARAARKPVGLADAWFNRNVSSLKRTDLRAAQIYHSPLFAIPKAARRLKRVLTVYDLIPLKFPDLVADGAPALLRAVLGSLRPDDIVICISQATKNDLCEHLPWLDPGRVVVIYQGAADHFAPTRDVATNRHVRVKYAIPPGPYFLSLSAIEPRKGISHLIECFARSIREGQLSDVNLVLAGPQGWKTETIFQMLARHAELQDRIILTGRVDEEDLSSLYSDALAFIFPSLYEGFGLPVLEAMQCGTPVITSNSSALPEVVGCAGILVPPRDVDSLCEAMTELHRNEGRRRELSRKAILRARDFSWEKCAKETIGAYRMALS